MIAFEKNLLAQGRLPAIFVQESVLADQEADQSDKRGRHQREEHALAEQKAKQAEALRLHTPGGEQLLGEQDGLEQVQSGHDFRVRVRSGRRILLPKQHASYLRRKQPKCIYSFCFLF